MKFLLAVLAGLIGSLTCSLPAAAAEKQIVGWVERVRLHPGNMPLEAKLDSGAEYSSIDATDIKEFTRNGEKWVRFEINDHHGKSVTLERKLLRHATIKRHFFKSQARPVVRLWICVGKFYRETDVNLVDRTGFIYPLLIGRKFMEGRLIIDPGVQHATEPDCGEQPFSE
jgi:hypothetical protein